MFNIVVCVASECIKIASVRAYVHIVCNDKEARTHTHEYMWPFSANFFILKFEFSYDVNC